MKQERETLEYFLKKKFSWFIWKLYLTKKTNIKSNFSLLSKNNDTVLFLFFSIHNFISNKIRNVVAYANTIGTIITIISIITSHPERGEKKSGRESKCNFIVTWYRRWVFAKRGWTRGGGKKLGREWCARDRSTFCDTCQE